VEVYWIGRVGFGGPEINGGHFIFDLLKLK